MSKTRGESDYDEEEYEFYEEGEIIGDTVCPTFVDVNYNKKQDDSGISQSQDVVSSSFTHDESLTPSETSYSKSSHKTQGSSPLFWSSDSSRQAEDVNYVSNRLGNLTHSDNYKTGEVGDRVLEHSTPKSKVQYESPKYGIYSRREVVEEQDSGWHGDNDNKNNDITKQNKSWHSNRSEVIKDKSGWHDCRDAVTKGYSSWYDNRDDDIIKQQNNSQRENLYSPKEERFTYTTKTQLYNDYREPAVTKYSSIKVNEDNVDSTSISDQESIKKHWEQQLASPDARLFPSQPAEVPKPRSPVPQDAGEFVSNVDSDSIADLAATRKRWETKVAQYEKEKALKSPPPAPEPVEPDPADLEYESNIDREIQLAIARERQLREEKRERAYGINRHLSDSENKYSYKEKVEHEKTMPIHKVPPPQQTVVKSPPKKVEPQKAPPAQENVYNKQLYNELTEADRGSPQVISQSDMYTEDVYEQDERDMVSPTRESIIEREIREQMKREAGYHTASPTHYMDKEYEQSEYERREKEQEVRAHESIIEREIREQQQREAAYSREKGIPYSPQLHAVNIPEPQTVFAEPEPEEYNQYVGSPPEADYDTMNHSPFVDEDEVDASPPPRVQASENRIAREFREQREREAELERMRKNAGLPQWQRTGDAEQEQTPFLESTGMDASGTLPKKIQQQAQRTSQVYPHSQQGAVKDTTPHKGMYNNKPASDHVDSVAQSGTPTRGYGPSVPQEEEEEEVSYFVKQETPIEREIRLAREREEEFRRSKGLPEVKPQMPPREVEVVLSPEAQPVRRGVYRKGDEGDERGTMKKYYATRLASEMEAEKQREVDLRRLGKINTTSEDRIGEPRKYREAEPVHGPVTPNYKRSSAPTTPVTPTSSTPVSAAPAKQTQVKHTETVNMSPEPPTNGVVDPVQSPDLPPAQPARHEHYTFRRTKNAAETKIEQELREMREREADLRNQRKILGQSVPDPEPENDQIEEHMTIQAPPPAEDTPVAPPRHRRRSNRATEWEKKFSSQ